MISTQVEDFKSGDTVFLKPVVGLDVEMYGTDLEILARMTKDYGVGPFLVSEEEDDVGKGCNPRHPQLLILMGKNKRIIGPPGVEGYRQLQQISGFWFTKKPPRA